MADIQTSHLPQNFVNAYYIKLGRAGCWEVDSISCSKMRFGWEEQDLDDLNGRAWDRVEQQLRQQYAGKPPGTATTDFNRLKEIVESTPQDLWITFHEGKLWWGTVAAGAVEADSVSKFRRMLTGWTDRALNGKLLVATELPGKIALLQGFRGTACRVKEADILRRVITGEASPLARALAEQRQHLAQVAQQAIEHLHWKDYEVLVDLVFRHAGWARVSILGEQVKGFDLELREAVTNDRYLVQVKSQARRADVEETVSQFSPGDFRKIYFVVHSPANDLAAMTDLPEHVELLPPKRLAAMAVDAGLARWLEQKSA
jgi:hypothetical protein